MIKETRWTVHHRVPGWKNDLIVTLVNLYEFLGSQSLGHNHLVHESAQKIRQLVEGHNCRDIKWTSLVEPPISHHKEALLSTVLTPRVFHLVTERFTALGVEVDARDDHSVGHRGLVRAQAVGFRERQ